MNFYNWFLQLAQDASRMGCSRRLRAVSWEIWIHLYSQGVQPSVRAIVDYCVEDPERFADLRATEKPFDYRIAA